MNKKAKGALAAAAGAAILVGGAGTMAAWNDSASLGGGDVTAGVLNIDQQPGSGNWKFEDGTPFTPSTDRLVPGDAVVYTATYNITAEGTNLTATLTPTLAGVSGDLASLLDVTAEGDGGGEITESTTMTIGTKVTFKGETSGTEGQNESANLSGGSVVLQQTLN